MQSYLQDQLRAFLLHAMDHVPFYRRVWSELGITREELAVMSVDDLPRLPVTPKTLLQAMPERFVAENVHGRLSRYSSSGSTGSPVTSICTSDDHRRFIAAREVRSFGWAGTSIRRPRAMIGGRLVVPRAKAPPPYYRYNYAERQVYFSAFHITSKTVEDYVHGFNRYRPRVFTGYAYSYYLLARMMIEQELRLDYIPDALILGSEKLTAEMKSILRQVFRARAFEEYGSVENCGLATECEHGGLHVSPDFGIVEIVDAGGNPVPPGVEGRLVCTSLLNWTQPLIRYEVGDRGIWAADHCPCGRNHLPVVAEIVGRIEDAVVGPDGREMVRFHWVFLDLPNVREGQVVQTALDHIIVRVVANDGFGPVEEQLIRLRFTQRLGPVHVEIERAETLPRTERGKFRAVISLLSDEEKQRISTPVDVH
jgi:phenylacetate-CoA ligase